MELAIIKKSRFSGVCDAVTLDNPRKKIAWSEDEIVRLKSLYPHLRIKDLADKFPDRNKNTIVAKALSLKLTSAKLWQEEENSILQERFSNSSKEIISGVLPKRSWQAIVAQAERLGLQRNTAKPRRPVDENYFETWSPSMAYLLGFILADGCVIQGTYKGYSDALKFGVQLRDRDILETIRRELRSEHSISIVRNAAHFCITSQKIVDDLKRLGISYRKSLRENVPNVPQQFIAHFIRGIVDGDGSLWLDDKNYPTLSVCGGKTTLSFISEHFFKKFGLHSALTKCSYLEEAQNYLYQISYRCNSAQTLIEYLYRDADIFLNRKYATAMRCLSCKIKMKNNDEYRLKKYHETHTR